MLVKAEIVASLQELVDRLAAEEIRISIHIVGGAAIVLSARPDRQATRDIDAWLNGPETARIRLLDIAAQIATERGWNTDWINDNARLFIPESIGGAASEWTPLIDTDDIKVMIAQPQVLLAMKLRAGRGRRDLADLPALIHFCGLTTMAEIVAIFDHFYPHDDMSKKAADWLSRNTPIAP